MTPGAAMACARGIGIILVVLYHADVDLGAAIVGYQNFFGVVGTLQYVAVPTFLLCAGLAMSGKSRSAPRLIGEASNYTYVYLVWVAISLLLTATVAHANINIPDSPRSALKTIILPSSPLWFPYGLALMLVSAAVTAGSNRILRLGLVFLIGFIPLIPGCRQTVVLAVCSNVFLFYVGLLFRVEVFRLLTQPPLPVCLVATVGYFALLVSASRVGFVGLPVSYDTLSLLGFFALVSFWRLQSASIVSRVVATLGRAALPILVIHDFWLHLGERSLVWLTGGRVAGLLDYVLPASLSAFALFASLATLRLIGRVSPVFIAPRLLTDGTARFAARLERLSWSTARWARLTRS